MLGPHNDLRCQKRTVLLKDLFSLERADVNQRPPVLSKESR